MPSRVKQIQPWLSYCTEVFFTAYDPPIVLRAASALAPPVASSDPEAHPRVPAPSLTVDPVARQTVGSKPSIPLPASTPTVDQPKATTNAAQNPPSEKGFGSSPRPENGPASQESPLLLPTHAAAGPNSDLKGNNDHQQSGNLQPSSDNDPPIESDPDQAFHPKKSNDSGGSLEDGTDPELHSSPTQGDSSHGSEQIVDPVSQDNDTEQTNEENCFNDFTKGQTKTINDQVIQPLSHGISIAGTTLTPGAPPITVSGTPIHFGPSAPIVGTSTSTVPLVPENPSPDLLTATIAGHVITATPTALVMAGTTLTPGAPPIIVSGTQIHFASSALLIIGRHIHTTPRSSNPDHHHHCRPAHHRRTKRPHNPKHDPQRGISRLESRRNAHIPGYRRSSIDCRHQKHSAGIRIREESHRDGKVNTAFPDGIAIALTPGASGAVEDGTLLSGQAIVGSKSIALFRSGRSIDLVMGLLPSVVSADPTCRYRRRTAHPITALVMAGTTSTPGPHHQRHVRSSGHSHSIGHGIDDDSAR